MISRWIFLLLAGTVAASAASQLDNNLKCVDLSDLAGPLPLRAVASRVILKQSEDWEASSYKNPRWPKGGHRSLGYPTVVKNVHGQNPDSHYYLFYAHHDPMSGIGCAVAKSIGGPYVKLADLPGSKRKHSRVLTVPNYRASGPNPDDPSHFSSPCVVWNSKEKLWFMYFHYYNHFHGRWKADPRSPGAGSQMTALATCADLAKNEWTIWTTPRASKVSVWDIVPVLPTTEAAWMRGASSYHAIQQLPNPKGDWLAFMRGTPAAGPGTSVGFATSLDGRNWLHLAGNPAIASGKPWTKPAREYRPAFIGWLGGKKYLVAWSEHAIPHVIYSTTTDFQTFKRDPRGYAKWQGPDGLVSPWREGNRLYLFAGHQVHELALPVRTK